MSESKPIEYRTCVLSCLGGGEAVFHYPTTILESDLEELLPVMDLWKGPMRRLAARNTAAAEAKPAYMAQLVADAAPHLLSALKHMTWHGCTEDCDGMKDALTAIAKATPSPAVEAHDGQKENA